MLTKYRFTTVKPATEIEIDHTLENPMTDEMQEFVGELKDAMFDHRPVSHPLLFGALVIKYELTIE